MIIIFLGLPGSGKGTQAKLLAEGFNFSYFETGAVLRQKAKEKTSLGIKISKLLKEGKIIPDSITQKIMKDWLEKNKTSLGIIFDGFPRTLSQYFWLQKFLAKRKLKITKAIYLKIKDETAIKRLIARRVCSNCGREFNLLTHPPKKDKICDFCGKKLIRRSDDRISSIKSRLQLYHQLTQPLIFLFQKERILEEINGEQRIKKIYRDILERLKLKK